MQDAYSTESLLNVNSISWDPQGILCASLSDRFVPQSTGMVQADLFDKAAFCALAKGYTFDTINVKKSCIHNAKV